MRRVIISVDQSHNPSLLSVESSRPFRGASNLEGDLLEKAKVGKQAREIRRKSTCA